MTTPTTADFHVGERVQIIGGFGLAGRIVDIRGPVPPNGDLRYRVRLRKRPVPMYVEVPGTQLERPPAT